MKRARYLLATFVFATGLLPGCKSATVKSLGVVAVTGPVATSFVGGTGARGGVDVGNMQEADYVDTAVPKTSMMVKKPAGWTATTTDSELILDHRDAQLDYGPADFANLASPSAQAIKALLDAREAGRHEIVRFNGLDGVRSDRSARDGARLSKIYLISELGDFVLLKIRSYDAPAATAAEKVFQSTYLRYKGVAIDAQPIAVEFDGAEAYYGFKSSCVAYAKTYCPGVAAHFSRSTEKGIAFAIGMAGADTGRIVELGSESEVPFAKIQIEGRYLKSAGRDVELSDIYSKFSPTTLTPERSTLQLLEQHVYLVRTMQWPEEDLLIKMRVDRIDAQRIKITYQQLAEVPKEELQRQIDAMNTYSREVEMPREQGEVVLYNRKDFAAYSYAGFNFEYGTSGNPYITHNRWDLLFDGPSKTTDPEQLAIIAAAESVTLLNPFELDVDNGDDKIAEIIDIGTGISLQSLTIADFPIITAIDRSRRSIRRPAQDHVYLVQNALRRDGTLVLGAVRVLAIPADGAWIHLAWRRISVTHGTDFKGARADSRAAL